VIYTNLFIFISAIFLFSLASGGGSSDVSLIGSLSIYAASVFGYWLLVKRLFNHSATKISEGYFLAEKKLYIAALLFFSIPLFLGDIRYFLSFLSINELFPFLTNVAGLVVFFSYLSLMWLGAHKSYAAVFNKQHSPVSFVLANFKFNLPIVLPWIALSLMYDLLNLVPYPTLDKLLESIWGDISFLAFFLLLVLLFFPPLVRTLWNCRKMDEGPLKNHLIEFCNKQNFKADLYIWPLYEGRILTAGVLGLIPGLRYIMVTPALIQNLNWDELEAVMSHEIGHVKYRHLLLYVMLIAGFSLLAGFLAEPILYFSLSMDWVLWLVAKDIFSAETIITLIGGLPLLILLILYFRFVFGYFIRNFERQADLHVIKVLGNSRTLISAFERILLTSGQKGDKPNWHHFGVGERITHLQLCQQDPSWILRQDRKIKRSLVAYALILVAAITLLKQVPADQLAQSYEGKYIETVLMPKLHGGEDEASWFRLLGDLLLSRKLEDKALSAYTKALQLDPENPEALNNLAWLLLTSKDVALRNPGQALMLARSAAELNPLPHVLDTLATAYWANGNVAEAVRIEIQALEKDSSQAPFYRFQLQRFQTQRYDNHTEFIN